MSLFAQNLNELNLILEVLEKIEKRQAETPELQEGENRDIIRDFRKRMIDKLLTRIRSLEN